MNVDKEFSNIELPCSPYGLQVCADPQHARWDIQVSPARLRLRHKYAASGSACTALGRPASASLPHQMSLYHFNYCNYRF